jgi:O-antigen/teichoic acid export membrane protein
MNVVGRLAHEAAARAMTRVPLVPGDTSTEHGLRAERDRRAVLTVLVGILARIASAVIGLLTIPLLLRHLGLERYGLWLTVAAGSSWLGLLQFGLAPSLLNRLASLSHASRGERARYVSSAWWLGLAVAVVAAAGVLVLYQVAPWDVLFNVSKGPLADDARAIATAMWIGVAIGVPLSMPAAILRSRQEGYVANAWDIAASVLGLAALVVAVAVAADVGTTAIAVVAGNVVARIAMARWLFARHSRELRPRIADADLRTGVTLVRTGSAFTGLSVAALLISYTDVIIVTQLFGPAAAPTYAVPYSLFALFVSLELVVLDAVWPAYAESASKGDAVWLRRTHRRVERLLVAAALAFAVALVALGQPVVEFITDGVVSPPTPLLAVLAVLAVVQSYQLAQGRLLTALGHVRINTLAAFLNALINVPLSVFLASRFGITGVAAGTLIGYLVISSALVYRARHALTEGELAAARRDADPPATAQSRDQP